MFLKGGRPPPPLQTHPHTHTMHEKRQYNGALRILAVFRGRAGQPASQGGGGGGFQSLPATQPRLGAAPTQPSLKCSLEETREIYRTATWEPQSIRISPMYRNHSSECFAHGILQGMCHGRIRAPSVRVRFLFGDPCVVVPALSAKCANAPYHESCFYATSSTSTMKVDDGGSLLSRVNFIDHPFCLATMSLWECHTFDSG